MHSIEKFFIYCAGIPATILKRTPTDTQKYVGIGATVFFTGVLAALSGGYALFTVFDSYIMAVIFGLIWGLTIFNLDRYIVLSLKKKDQWWKEWGMAIPRLVLAVLIAFVIAKPLELKLFEGEINAELSLMQQERALLNEEAVHARFINEGDQMKNEIAELQSDIEVLRVKRDALSLAAVQEADGTGGSGKRNLGPIYKAKKRDADLAQTELEALQAVNLPLIEEKRAALLALDTKEAETVDALEEASMTGLASRLDALGRRAAQSSTIWWSSLFITLLFIAIETAPIFVKLISSRGPLDYRLDAHELRHWADHAHVQSRLLADVHEVRTVEEGLRKTEIDVLTDAEIQVMRNAVAREVEKVKEDQWGWQMYLKNRPYFKG